MIAMNHILLDWKKLLLIFGFLSVILTINLKTPILLVSGLTFTLLALLVWFCSMCVTFVGLHKLLQHKEPIPRSFFHEYLKLLCVSKPSPRVKINLKPDAQSIKRLTVDIDKYFISKWYSNISKNQDFPNESKVFLEEVLTRLVDVSLQVNHKCVLHGISNIYLKHLKEFRRSLKRKQKYNVGTEELYRYSHICSTSNSKKNKTYFIHQMTSDLLRHFINSELWNSLPCHILVSVLARRFIFYLLDTLSNPHVLNYIIFDSIVTNDIKGKLNLDKYGRIAVVEFFDVVDKDKSKEIGRSIQPAQGSDNYNDTESYEKYIQNKAKELQQKVVEASKQFKKEEQGGRTTQESFLEEKVVLRHKKPSRTEKEGEHTEKSPKRSNPVKIYESKSTVRTWRDSRDLACVSLGQDPLDALQSVPDNGGKVGTKPGFWESSLTKPDDNKHDSPPSAALLFNEVMHMPSMEGLKSSIKPFSDATERTLHNIKDLQETTVHNALHKIGDFQVNANDKKQIENLNYLHYLPPHTLLHSSVLSNTRRLLYAQQEDEAAGVVEGILDFGRAGFRKGLRLTGLQDNVENAKATVSGNASSVKSSKRSVKEQVKKKLEELKKSDSDSQERMSSAESVDSVWINPLIDSPSYDGHILLYFQRLNKVISCWKSY